MRLGAGVKGSRNDMKALMSHPFFSGIDFDNLHSMTPPLSKTHESEEVKEDQHITTAFQKPMQRKETTPNFKFNKDHLLKKEEDWELVSKFSTPKIERKELQ
jgi:hypothetical protein